jgi:hypothetical protein
MKIFKLKASTIGIAALAAQLVAARADDIVSIKSDYANMVFTESGAAADFKITLAGTFALTNAYGGVSGLLPQLRLIVNGDVAWASLDSLIQYKLYGVFDRTDVIFRYTVQSGDMAQPMKIYGSPTLPYQFVWNGWEVRNTVNGSAAVWRFDPAKSQSGLGEVFDIDLAKAKITLRTLAFDDLHSPVAVTAGDPTLWRVGSVNPVGPSAVSFVVWTPATNIVQLGATPGQTALQVNLPSGATSVDFLLKGLAGGTGDVYLQRVGDYQANATLGVTNYIKRSLSVTPQLTPTVRVVLLDTGSDVATLDESYSPNTGAFQIELSEAFSNDVWVSVDATPAGQSNVTFSASPYTLCVSAGARTSSSGLFSMPDGTALSAWAGVSLTPVVTSPDAAAHYTRLRGATVYVNNAKPTILNPQATDIPTVLCGQPHGFQWAVGDVAADLAAGMEVTWQFGDGTASVVVTGATGTVTHTFYSVGPKVVRVVAQDKDGGVSDDVQLTVFVDEPHVRVTSSELVYSETPDGGTGYFRVYLSEPYPEDVWVRLETDPLSQSNLTFASTNAFRIAAASTNSAASWFSLKDGTQDSAMFGITVTPIITSSPASSYYTGVRSATVFVTNSRPQVTSPSEQGLQVPFFVPYTFNYSVDDVSADLGTMIVRWNFGDGTTATVTGAVGAVSHTYATLGDKTVWLEAEDKDGSTSSRVQFIVTVFVPRPPTVAVVGPKSPVLETSTPNTGNLSVYLSEPFTNAVTVALNVTPATNKINGALLLSTNLIIFAPGETQKVVHVSARDGTEASRYNGFAVTPSVMDPASAVAHYTSVEPGGVALRNIPPIIYKPVASDLQGNPVYTMTQGRPFSFTWLVSDVWDDLGSLQLTWYFGDGGTLSVTGATGVCTHTYLSTGDFVVTATVIDKDGGYNEVRFKVQVVAATGFALWAAQHGLSGYPYELFALDRNDDGIANGFEYAFGDNLTNGVPLMTIRLVDGAPVVETPLRAAGTTGDAFVTVQACTNLLENQWNVPMGPSNHAVKPVDRDWYAPLVALPGQAFFRLRVQLE